MKNDKSYVFFIITGVMIAVGFLLFYPKVNSRIFSYKRQSILNSFLNNTISQGKIDPQKYWEFREFYSPGYFDFSHNGFDQMIVEQVINSIAIPIITPKQSISFLKFNSQNFNSLDLLISDDLEINLQPKKTRQVIFQNKHGIIYKEGGLIKIAFVFSEKEMNTANGFYDFNGADKLFLQNKYWLNISSITIPY